MPAPSFRGRYSRCAYLRRRTVRMRFSSTSPVKDCALPAPSRATMQ